jgi:hypothetical protein
MESGPLTSVLTAMIKPNWPGDLRFGLPVQQDNWPNDLRFACPKNVSGGPMISVLTAIFLAQHAPFWLAQYPPFWLAH